jgi:aminoglycoside phosphotransferase (APT) family kinase protein
MHDHASKEALPANLQEHRAFKAWRQFRPECAEPQQIEILKLKSKSAVYRLSGVGPNGSAVIAKRCPAATGGLEDAIYNEFLGRLPQPALRCYGFVPEAPGLSAQNQAAAGAFGWLFLEDAGRHAYSPDNGEHRAMAGQWLGAIHRAQFPAELQARLPDRGPDHYLQLLRSSRAAVLAHVDNPVLSSDEKTLLRTMVDQCDLIESRWGELEKFFEDRPRRLVHGDFVIKNLRLRNNASEPALLVYDWEMAGWGVPATDLAQSLGRCASPDLDAYCSVLKQDDPQIEVHDFKRLADYGYLLRLVDKIFWDTVGIGGDTYEFLLRPVLSLRYYEPQVAAALRALDWKPLTLQGAETILEGSGLPGLTELRNSLEELLDARETPVRFLEQQMLQPKSSRVFRLRFAVKDQTRTVVIKRLKPAIARRNELVGKRWLPAIGLNDKGAPLLGSVAERTGACVWHIYDDLGQHELDPRQPDREQVGAAVELIARMHTRFAAHALLGEVRLHGGDFGIHFYESNVLDAIYALEAWQANAQQSGLRCRLLERLYQLRDALPQRAQELAEWGGPETLLHGDLWAINVFVIPAADGWHARLIDWDHAAVGPASYDLSTFLMCFPAQHRSWILELYREAVAEAGWSLPGERELNLLFETHEHARFANRIIWAAIALAIDQAAWGFEALAEIEEWFEQFEPVLQAENEKSAESILQ